MLALSPQAARLGTLAVQERVLNITDSQAAFCQVHITNTSPAVWASEEPNPVHISYHWFDPRGQTASYDGQRTKLPRPLAPGETLSTFVRIHPPGVAGQYVLEIDLVQEGVQWFEIGERFHVEVRPTTQLRTILVNRNCVMNDAVGNNIVRKLRLLKEQGLAPLFLTEHIDERLPRDDQAMMVAIDTLQITNPEPRMQWAANHFWNAELYIFDYPEYYPLLELMRFITRGTVVFDYHSVTPPQLWRSAHSRLNVERGITEVRLVALADYAIAHSEYTRAELIATNLIDAQRIFVVPYAVPIGQFNPDASAEKPPELTPDDGPVLLYVGRMAGNKRIDVLIRMVAKIKQRYPRVKLLLVGDDVALPYQDVVAEARNIISELDLQNTVVFTGARNHEELPRYYRACDVYVTSSEHEGFCIPVIEAMACGKPVVAAAATALPWTVGDAGLLFEPGNADECAARVLELLDSKFHT
jgi:glycosyltransferase involved in cell wall biosynthesis